MEQEETSRPEVTVNVNTPVVVAATFVTLAFMRVTSKRLRAIIHNQHEINRTILELRQDALSSQQIIQLMTDPKRHLVIEPKGT